MKREIDEETKEIIVSFIAEGYERLDDAEGQLGKLEEGDNTERFNTIFRLFHSMKGSAGFLNFDNVKSLTHQAETLLEVFLKEKIPHNPDAIDTLYDSIDLLRAMVGAIERDFHDEDFSAPSKEQSAKLAACIADLRSGAKPGSGEILPADAIAASATGIPEWSTPALPNEIPLNELVTREMAERFLSESDELLDNAERETLDLESNRSGPETIHSLFRHIHTIKGNAGFFGYVLLEKYCQELEGYLDEARKGKMEINDAFTSRVLKRIDVLRATVRSVSMISGDDAQTSAPAPESAALQEAPSAQQAPVASVEELKTESAAKPQGASDIMDSGYKPLGEILVDIGAAKAEDVQQALDAQTKPVGEILVEKGQVSRQDVEKALGIQKTLSPAAERLVPEEMQRKEIRVDTLKLDKLFNLVGELITAEAMLVNSPDLAGLKLDSFMKSYTALNKISREIQETTMMIRMIPLDGLFNKMSRLVRDLSRKFDKKIDFTVSGQDTEMDKNVIEQISDPLVHILRNAIDHGVETTAARLAAGKSETGKISLHAKYEGSEIWVTVTDDGGGLSRERILAKAIQKGMVVGDGSALSDKEVWRFIFAPGFSTADKVSDISGRGVGMDVVGKNLERIRGRVEIHSEAGKGSEFVLMIPLTMAIIDAINVRVGKNIYSLPLNDISEFFKIQASQITVTGKGAELVNLRGQVIPLLKLYEIFNVKTAVENPEDGIIIVVSANNKRACLLIDEVIGNQQIVIKSLSEFIGKVDGVSGCTILGDGGVSFIIDTARLLSRRLE